MAKKKETLVYKGFPLVRNGNIMYYGNITDKYIIMLQVLSSSKTDDLEISEKVSVQLLMTGDDVSNKDRIVRSVEKQGIYDAIDIASVWLERALSGK